MITNRKLEKSDCNNYYLKSEKRKNEKRKKKQMIFERMLPLMI